LIDRCADNGALQIAEAFAYCGDADRAFEWLERAYQQRDSGLPQMQSWPLLRNLHSDHAGSASQKMDLPSGPIGAEGSTRVRAVYAHGGKGQAHISSLDAWQP
jgi:hypothetical protein